jgi:hypothetical protein
MKIKMRGTVAKIGEPKKAGNSTVREIVLNKKYHDPDSGDLKSEDNFPVQIWEDKFPDFEKQYHVSSLMEIEGFLNGRLVGEGGEARCFMNFVGRSFKKC